MQRMYSLVLLLHSYVRWLVLIAGILAVVRALGAMSSGRSWDSGDDGISRLFTGSLDLQMLMGLLLYAVLSPFTTEAFGDMGAAMRNPQLRFWVVEHLFGMVVAVALAHIGWARIKRSSAGGERRHRQALIFYGLAMLMILLTIPWPGLLNGRPLLRGILE